MRTSAVLLLLIASSAHADWAAGQDVWPALYVDLTVQGFDQVEPIASAVLPPTIPIELPSQQGSLFDIGLVGAEYFIGLNNFYVVPTIETADIVPQQDRLDITLQLDVSLSAPNDPAVIELDVDADVLFDLISIDDAISEDCNIYTTRPIPVTATTTLGLEVDKDRFGDVIFDVDGNIALDATLGDIELNIGLTPGTLAIEDCLVGDIVEFVLDVGFGSVEEFLLAEIEPIIDEEVAAVVGDLEPQIEDAFDALVIGDSLDLLGTSLDFEVYPRDFFLSPDGMRLEMAGVFQTGEMAHPCVSAYDTGFSLQTLPPVDPRYPALEDQPLVFPHHVGIMVNDDWLNQALYATWRGGLLCQAIDADTLGDAAPIALDTTLLNAMSANQFAVLFPDGEDTPPAPLQLVTRPEAPPTLTMNGENTVDITLDQMGLDMYAELDGRFVRMVGYDLQANAGVDVDFDGGTGAIAAEILFDPEEISASLVFNDILPSADEQMSRGFSTLVQFAAPILTDLLADSSIEFELPSAVGIGLTSADVLGAGPIEDFAGVFGTVGLVPYGDAATTGCDLFGSDSSSGCDGGCNSAGPARAGWFAFMMLIMARRRR